MGCVSNGVKHSNHILVHAGIDGDHVCSRDAYILSKCAVTVYTHAVGVLTPLDVAVVAVTAVAAGDVAFAGYALANCKAGHSCA